MKRVLIRLGIPALIVVAGALWMLWLTGPTHCITRQMREQIRQGMTLDEVEAILGSPPGIYFNGPAWMTLHGETDELGLPIKFSVEDERDLDLSNLYPDADHHYTWVTCTAAVGVHCNAEHRVISTSFFEVRPRSALLRFQLRLLNR